jgi:hypothetical protein
MSFVMIAIIKTNAVAFLDAVAFHVSVESSCFSRYVTITSYQIKIKNTHGMGGTDGETWEVTSIYSFLLI